VAVLGGCLLWLLAGAFAASLAGHWVHFALHRRWSGPAHRAHMRHHLELYPPQRLVSARYLGPGFWKSGTFLFGPPAVLIAGLAVLAGAPWSFVVGLAGFSFASDFAHDRFHVPTPALEKFSSWKRLREAHFRHHLNMRRNYGILTLGWDRAFGTLWRGDR
jgi:sterol desaturase/sphingolipid hydroxylase (fatty acid hydroxylase superfamily)